MITTEDIKADIAVYQQRLKAARVKLADLDPRGDARNTYYKNRRQRDTLYREIDHIKGLISMAEKALPEGEWYDGHS